jgi:hypothetical protein
VPEFPGSARFRELWSLLAEGGLTVNTPDVPDAPVALRTVLQLDGDRVILVNQDVIAPLSDAERLVLLARHTEDVRSRSGGLLSGLHRSVAVLRGALLVGFGGGELANLASAIAGPGLNHVDWFRLFYDQLPFAGLLVARVSLPYGLRLAHAVSATALRLERRKVSFKMYTDHRATRAARMQN